MSLACFSLTRNLVPWKLSFQQLLTFLYPVKFINKCSTAKKEILDWKIYLARRIKWMLLFLGQGTNLLWLAVPSKLGTRGNYFLMKTIETKFLYSGIKVYLSLHWLLQPNEIGYHLLYICRHVLSSTIKSFELNMEMKIRKVKIWFITFTGIDFHILYCSSVEWWNQPKLWDCSEVKGMLNNLLFLLRAI